MIIKNVSVLVTKVDLKKSSKGEAYLIIDMLDITSGDSFNLMSKNIDFMQKLQMMTKYKVDLNLTGGKYGLRLEIDKVNDEIGKI